LESKAKFLQYLHKTVRINYSIHDFIAQGMALFQETDFENWLMSLMFRFVSKHEKNYEAVETIIKFSSHP
jgi:hypothetical protein